MSKFSPTDAEIVENDTLDERLQQLASRQDAKDAADQKDLDPSKLDATAAEAETETSSLEKFGESLKNEAIVVSRPD